MVPYKDNDHLTITHTNFNKCLSSSRVVVEQAFGKLIGRFIKLKLILIFLPLFSLFFIVFNDNLDQAMYISFFLEIFT